VDEISPTALAQAQKMVDLPKRECHARAKCQPAFVKFRPLCILSFSPRMAQATPPQATRKPINNDAELAESNSLGARMKRHEQTSNIVLDPTMPFMVRLDGRKFSKFTAGLKRPFDMQFANVMTAVASDLLEEFNPRTVYTQSDEISLLFYPGDVPALSQHIFGGRVHKIVSVFAAFATARLVKHLSTQPWSDYPQHVQDRMLAGYVAFDGRAFSLDDTEMCNCIIWRCCHDCIRNTTSNYAHHEFGHSAIVGWSGIKMREELKKAGIDWHKDIPDRARFGVFLKKMQYTTVVEIPGGVNELVATIEATRTRIVSRSFKLDRATDQFVALLKAKYVTDWQ